jgi:hypothetical protein
MTNPITPPPELVRQWADEWAQAPNMTTFATRAAQWGAGMELEACCEWVAVDSITAATELRAWRRSKPPSLKEQGLDALESLQRLTTDPNIIEPLRRALEQLPE